MKVLLIFALIVFSTLQQVVRSSTAADIKVVTTAPPTHDEIVGERTATDADFVTLAYSGDGTSSEVISSGANSRTALPFDLPSDTRSSLPKADQSTISVNPFPWLPNANLISPGPTTVILNAGIVVIYQITFYSDCPQNTILMHLHVWDNFIIYDPDTNQQIYPTPGTWGSPICNLIKIKAKCGCNKLWIVLYNWQNPSYYSIWYELYQSQTNCYNCTANPDDSFYNR